MARGDPAAEAHKVRLGGGASRDITLHIRARAAFTLTDSWTTYAEGCR